MASVERDQDQDPHSHRSFAERVLDRPEEKGKNPPKEGKRVGLKAKIMEVRKRLRGFLKDVSEDDGLDDF